MAADGAVAAAAGAGWASAWRAYRHADKGYVEPIAEYAPHTQKLLLNKYYVDEGYDYIFTGRRKVGGVRLGVLGLGEVGFCGSDTHVVDGLVNFVGRFMCAFSRRFPVGGISGLSMDRRTSTARRFWCDAAHIRSLV